jgi:uncharacterized membrane protein YGL010W
MDANELIEQYAESHRNPTNKAIHWVCVPAIMFSTIGLLWAIPHQYMQGGVGEPWSAYLNWGSVAIALSLIFYFRMSFTVGVGMSIWGAVLLWLCHMTEVLVPVALWKVSLAIFAIAWVLQFVGHKIEGKKPSFFQDIFFLLVGPAWLLSAVYSTVGIPFASVSPPAAR